MMFPLDFCPRCRRRIFDNDDDGIEAGDGQRWCYDHAPNEVLAEIGEPRTCYYTGLTSHCGDCRDPATNRPKRCFDYGSIS